MTAQEEFDAAYITSTEVCQELGVTRATIVRGKQRGKLPEPITLKGTKIQIWRRELMQPYLDAWKAERNARQGTAQA